MHSVWYLGSDYKESAYNVGDLGLISETGRCSGEENDNPLYYSSLENSMDRGVWQAIAHGVAKSWTCLSDLTLSFSFCILSLSSGVVNSTNAEVFFVLVTVLDT